MNYYTGSGYCPMAIDANLMWIGMTVVRMGFDGGVGSVD